MSGEEGTAPPREQGWWGLILATMALLFVPATPIFRLAVPVEQTLLLLVPACAVCAVVGWRSGGRLPLAIVWTALAVWVLWQPAGDAGRTFLLLTRGWAALLAAAFGAMLLSPVGEGFLPKALAALLAASLVGGLLVLVASGGADGASEVLRTEISRRAAASTAQWREMTSTAEWQEFLRNAPDAGRLSDEVDRQLAEMPAVARQLFPALLALESLAALALGWAIYHRVGRVRLGPPLARLRDLRFADALVWGVVVGLVMVVLPFDGAVRTLGVNLLVFFGVLYALRGLGVMVWFLAPGRWMAVFLVIFTVLFWHVVGMVAAVVGLGDTWFEWRRRTRPKSQRLE